MIEPTAVLAAAAELLSDGENEEYDRALAELSATLIDVNTDHKWALLADLRRAKSSPDCAEVFLAEWVK